MIISLHGHQHHVVRMWRSLPLSLLKSMLFFFAFQSPPEQMRDGQTLGEKSFVMKMINILERKIEQELGVRRVYLFTYIVNCHYTFFCIFINFKELL